MARFFFDTRIDESHMRDAEGLEYDNVARAYRDVRKSLVSLVAEALGQDADHDAHHCAITMRDGRGQVIARFSADLREESGPV